MKTSIIILTYNNLPYTKTCIESIRTYTLKNSYEIIVVDNNSEDGTVEWLKEQKDIITVFNKENLGFPKGCNQGIEVASGENVLLLNNDTVVTNNWLENLIKCLYSAEDIGAVGPVTNSASYYSNIPVTYSSLEEMQKFALNYNISNSSEWEERLKLIGFCMLIKRAALEKTGYLDERFTPGNFEDDDYSLRLRKDGYRLILCRDTFIHHFGSVSWKEESTKYNKLLSENGKKFKAKWGIDTYCFEMNPDFINLINFKKEKFLNVLHIGCKLGGFLLKFKQLYPNAKLYGVEQNELAHQVVSRYSEVVCNYYDDNLSHVKYDLIVFSDEHNEMDDKLIQFISEHLVDDGIFLGKLLNISHFEILQDILNGKNPIEFKNRKMYSLLEIEKMFKDSDIQVEVIAQKTLINKENQWFIDQLVTIKGEEAKVKSCLESEFFILKGKKTDMVLKVCLDKIINSNESDSELLQKINQYEFSLVNDLVNNFENPVTTFNKIAIDNFILGYHEHVLPFLQSAFLLNMNDTDTLYNIAFVLNSFGEKKLAKDYIERIKNPDEEVRRLYKEINIEQLDKIQLLTYLLRRIEFDVDIDETKKVLSEILYKMDLDSNSICEIINTSIIDKVKVYQMISIICVEQEKDEQAVIYLQNAYELDKNNSDTIYNLGYILLKNGYLDLAKQILEQIQEPDKEILDLLLVAQGGLGNE